MVRTKFTERKRYFCPIGDHYENEYQEEIDKKTGRKHLVVTGKTDIYSRIQADLEDCKIENIIHKLALGDLSVFREAKLTYADADDFPKSLMEAQNIVVKAKSEFDKMPKDVRELFHNSPEEYVSQMGTQEFIDKLAPFNDDMAKREKADKDAAFNAKVAETAAFNKAVNKAMEGEN